MSTLELSPGTARLLADGVLCLHVGFVAFVVLGLAFVWIGHGFGWRWVDRRGFRWLHAGAIAIVVAQAWLGAACPLTVLEYALRRHAGDSRLGEGEGFVAGWLGRLLYWDAPAWVFTLVYSLFGLAVLATMRRFPPRR